METFLKPSGRFPCTYPDCDASFLTEKDMRNHKKVSPEHDYCDKCKEDFPSHEDLANHKAFRPDVHGKACRVCGEEFKSTSGLKRHIELLHKIDQKLICPGCNDEFYRASLLIEHLEFGHCKGVSSMQFQGHIVHKYLITELLKGGYNMHRFQEKVSHYGTADDDQDEGGVNIIDNDDGQLVEYAAIQPEIPESANNPQLSAEGPYPALPSQRHTSRADSELASQLSSVALHENKASSVAALSTVGAASTFGTASTVTAVSSSTARPSKAWDHVNSSKSLFPNAKHTPAPSEWSVENHDRQRKQEHGVNIMTTRFWDPLSDDFNADRFYDSVLSKYYCPFICEQTFDIPADVKTHIIDEHRISKMRCPVCLKHYKSCAALVSHCESRGSKCFINKTENFATFLDRITGGFLGVRERIRPEFINNPTVMVVNPETGKLEKYQPPTATYLQYEVTKPADWKEPPKKGAYYRVGSGGSVTSSSPWLD